MDNPKPKTWHSLNYVEVFKLLTTSEKGLSDAEAEKRLKENGFNELHSKPAKTLLQMLKGQLLDPMVLILLVAGVVSVILKEKTEATVIFVIIILNAVISIVQERKAQSSLEALKNMSTPNARVLREGEESVIPANELVVGDIIFLGDGDMVPADIRLIEAVNLRVQETSLTGESVSSEKDADLILEPRCPLGDRCNMLYASSIVTYGRAIGVVVSTGMETEVGKIAEMLEEEDEFDTPLKRKLNSVGKILTVIGLIVCVLIFAIGALYERPLVPQFLIAISLAISIIPEGLPATATIVMALGVQRMAKKNALIRKLPAVETLGNATVICSDKTGTLTMNKMQVQKIATYKDIQRQQAKTISEFEMEESHVKNQLILASALCNDASFDPDREGEIIGDPTEGALISMVQKLGLNHDFLERKYPRLFELPFDSNRKRMSTLHNINEKYISYTKGAIDEMLPLCTHILTNEGVRPITAEDKKNILELAHLMSEQALRLLGFSTRELEYSENEEWENLEENLTFIGVVGMSDPPRKEVAHSVKTCKEAGIRTVMITGDHKVTALAIAKELGIYQEGDNIFSGEELNLLSDEELDKVVTKTSVYARVSPADKLRIIHSLKRNGEVTAMTGDGVNDSPALKAADIGIAMGKTGTDVAKDASDMILLDDSFSTIVHAVKEGRRVYQNIQKVIQFLLVGNIAEILTLFVATVLNWDAPLNAVHILWVNLATATLPALALGVDQPNKNIMKHQPTKSGTLFEKKMVLCVIIQGAFVAFTTTCAYWIGVKSGGYILGQSMAFGVLAFSQIFRSFNQGSNTDPIWVRGEKFNIWLVISFAISSLLMLGILMIPFLQEAFKITGLSLKEWIIVLGLSAISIIQMEIMKFYNKKFNKDKKIYN